MEDSSTYYRRRSSEESAAAERAVNAEVAAIHRSLAERYSALAGELQPNPLADGQLATRDGMAGSPEIIQLSNSAG